MVDYLVWVWLAVLCVSAALEFITMQMVSIWFAIASIVAIILALCGVVWWVQVIVFCVLALVLLLGLRKFSMKFLLKNTNTKTNVDSFVGSVHKLVEPINVDEPGAVKINGVVWTAVSKDNKPIKKGLDVKIENVDGNKLIVSKVEDKNNKGD